jgi:tubulin-folding cofactor B
MRIPEVRLSKLDPVIDVKMHLEKRFGTQAKNMTLVLKNLNGENLAVMDNDYQTIGAYGVDNDSVIHCIDEDPNSILKGLEDLDSVEKYVMSDEDYDKLSMNVKKFKKQLKKNNPELF